MSVASLVSTTGDVHGTRESAGESEPSWRGIIS